MSRRKILLLTTIGVLAVILVFQAATGGGTSIRTYTLVEKIDGLTIRKPDGSTLALKKTDGEWVVGEKNYPGDKTAIDSLADKVASIKVLETVSSRGAYERYDLTPEAGIRVSATANGKEVRTLTIGKATSTARQSYILLDGGKDVLLVSGNLNSDFSKSTDNLRDKAVYTVEAADVSRISVSGLESYTLEKEGDSSDWTLKTGLAGDTPSLDSEKVKSWIQGIATLRAADYPEDAETPESAPLGKVVLTAGDREIEVTVFSKGEDDLYLCSSSESPYLFHLYAFAGERYLKPLDELILK